MIDTGSGPRNSSSLSRGCRVSSSAFVSAGPAIIKRFLESGRSGFYLGVVQEGVLEASDVIERVRRDPHELSVADIVRLLTMETEDLALLRRALDHPTLPAGLRGRFQKRLQELTT